MRASLRALLSGAIDYAGLFPPAKLPLPEALDNYARYRGEPEAWMLGRFVVPASRLIDIDSLPHGPPLVFSVLGRGGDTPQEYAAGLSADVEAVSAFRDRWKDRVVVDAFEGKLPPPQLGDRSPTK